MFEGDTAAAPAAELCEAVLVEGKDEVCLRESDAGSTSGSDDMGGSMDGDSFEYEDIWDMLTSPVMDQSDEAGAWLPGEPRLSSIPYTAAPGLLVNHSDFKPIDFFDLLFSEPFFKIMVRETNSYGSILLPTGKKGNSKQPRTFHWKELTTSECKKFLGLLLHMGNVAIKGKLENYWKRKSKLYNFPLFHEVMSRDRFQDILRCLRFSPSIKVGESLPYDPLYEIRPLLDHFHTTMNSVYYPGRELNIREPVLLWKGRLYSQPSLRSNRHKDAIEIYTLEEPRKTVLKLLINIGVKESVLCGKDWAERVIHSLLDGYKNKGHSVYLDSCYNSFSLSQSLLLEATYSTGPLRPGRRGNPTHFATVDTPVAGMSVATASRQGICVVKWKDRRLMISSEHDSRIIPVTDNKGRTSDRPRILAKYHKFLSGINRTDRVTFYAPFERRSLPWYIKVGIHIFHIMVHNSYLLYRSKGGRMRLQSYKDTMISCLLFDGSGDDTIRRMMPSSLPTSPMLHCLTTTQDSRKKRKRCRACSARGVRTDVATYCYVCPEAPGLCRPPAKCFDDYHAANMEL